MERCALWWSAARSSIFTAGHGSDRPHRANRQQVRLINVSCFAPFPSLQLSLCPERMRDEASMPPIRATVPAHWSHPQQTRPSSSLGTKA